MIHISSSLKTQNLNKNQPCEVTTHQPTTVTIIRFLAVFLFPRKCWQIIKNIKLGNCLISSCVMKTVRDRSLIIFHGIVPPPTVSVIYPGEQLSSKEHHPWLTSISTITLAGSWTYQQAVCNNIIMTGCLIISFVSDTTYTSFWSSSSAFRESFPVSGSETDGWKDGGWCVMERRGEESLPADSHNFQVCGVGAGGLVCVWLQL